MLEFDEKNICSAETFFNGTPLTGTLSSPEKNVEFECPCIETACLKHNRIASCRIHDLDLHPALTP